MLKLNVRIADNHFQEIHHALGCPWPDEIMGETYRNYFSVGDDNEASERMRASPHWTEGRKMFGSQCFHVSSEGREALLNHIREFIEVPARYAVTYKDYEGVSIVPARSRSAAKYKAYLNSEADEPFVEFVSMIVDFLDTCNLN